MKAKMVNKNGYDRLLRCSTPSECISILEEEKYFESSATASELLDPISWQTLFDDKIIALVKKLVKLSPDECARLLSEYEVQYCLESVKSSLRLMTSHKGEQRPSDVSLGDVIDDSARGAAEVMNVERLVQAAGAPFLYAEISSAIAEKKPLPIIEAIIDRHVLARVWGATDMRDWMDKESVRGLVGEQIDAINLLLTVRSKVLGITAEYLQQMLVPASYRLGDTALEATNAGSTTNALRTFMKTTYASSVESFLDTFKEGDSLHPLDVLLRRRHAASCLSVFTGFPFCAGLPLAFAYLRNYEALDLRSILSGKRDGLPMGKIEEFLILQKVL
jgi:vacuolar-type H+-ATPase subunit C/Vma6